MAPGSRFKKVSIFVFRSTRFIWILIRNIRDVLYFRYLNSIDCKSKSIFKNIQIRSNAFALVAKKNFPDCRIFYLVLIHETLHKHVFFPLTWLLVYPVYCCTVCIIYVVLLYSIWLVNYLFLRWEIQYV